ncbi:MAG: LPXTG cell wall anchor domain-containing protein [Ruminococcus sp.]
MDNQTGGPHGVVWATVYKNSGSTATATINDLMPGEYKIHLYTRNSNNEVFHYYGEELYVINKYTQPAMTIEGMPEMITYGDVIPLGTVKVNTNDKENGVGWNTRYIEHDSITSTNPEVAEITGNWVAGYGGAAELEDIIAKAPGEFSIVVPREGDTYYSERTDTFGPYTVAPKELTVDITVKDKQYDGLTDADFDAELVGVINNDDVKLVCDNVQADFASAAVGTDIPVSFTGEFTLAGEDADKYTLTQPGGAAASIYNDYSATQGTDYTVNSNDWLNTDFVVTAAAGFSLSLTDTADGQWVNELTASDETDNGVLKFYVKNNDTGAISVEASESYKIDKTAPTGKITLGGESSTEFLNEITFNQFFNKGQTAAIEGEDALSGMAKIEYALSDKPLTLDEVQALADWSEGNSIEIAAEDGKQVVCYARVTDNAGNVLYLSTNGAVFDTAAPTISSIADKGEYCISAEFTVDDRNLDTVQIDGADTAAADGKYVLEPGTHTVVVSDKAGNATMMEVTVHKDHQAGSEWKSDSESHWRECAVCGAELNEAAHTFTWVTDKKATATKAGSKHEECTVCGYAKEAVKIPAAGKSTGTNTPTGVNRTSYTNNRASHTNAPKTGDNSNMVFWAGVMLAAGAALTGTFLYRRKRKYN